MIANRFIPGLTLPFAVVLLGAMMAGGPAARPVRAPASYDVEFRFKGISGHHVVNAAACAVPISPNGYDILAGTITGEEIQGSDEDIEYTGTLKRTTAMDFCDIKGRRGPTDDEAIDCGETLIGAGAMTVKLTVYGEADRGAYLQGQVVHTDSVHASGNCDQREVAVMLADYQGRAKGGGGGGDPDGQLIVDTLSRPSRAAPLGRRGPLFYQNNQAQLRVGYYPPNLTDDGWALEVIRQVP